MPKRKQSALAWMVLVALLQTIPVGSPTFGDAIIFDSFSAVSGGRGGTNIAHHDNIAVLLENPSGMTFTAPEHLFEVHSALLFGNLHYSDPQNNTDGRLHLPENPGTGIETGLIYRPDGENVAFGAGLFVVGGFGTFLEQNSTFAGPQTYRSFAAFSKLVVGGSIEITEGLSVGANVGAAFHYAGLEGPLFFQTGPLAGAPALANLSATDIAPTWTVGMQYKLSEHTTLGLAYTAQTDFQMEGDANVTVFGLGPTPVSSSFDVDFDFTYPQSLAFGVQHVMSDNWRMSADLIWHDWSRAFDQLQFTFTNASNPAFAGTTTDVFPLGWRDTITLRIGIEFDLTEDDVLRFGYVYHRNPIPDATLTSYIPATTEQDFTIGYTHHFSDMTLHLAYMYAYAPTRNVNNSTLLGDDFSQSKTKNDYHVLWFGLSWSF